MPREDPRYTQHMTSEHAQNIAVIHDDLALLWQHKSRQTQQDRDQTVENRQAARWWREEAKRLRALEEGKVP